MIPRNLPGLIVAGLENGWDMDLYRKYYSSTPALFADFARSDEAVWIVWDLSGSKPRLIASKIGGVFTPYAQCAALIRSKETPS